MAVAARKALFEAAQPRVATPAPRPADETDAGPTSPVHDQHRALEAAFAARSEHPRLRAWAYGLLTLASLGLWAVIITAAIHVGQMVAP